MTEIRKHCFEKIKKIFDENDWEIIDKDTLLSKLEYTIFDVDLDERLRIYKITSPLWKIELLKMPELMEKNIYNITIKEARAKLIERAWTNQQFIWIYKNNYMKLEFLYKPN